MAKWKELKDYLTGRLYFAAAEDPQAEDLMTTTYLRDTATEAGLRTAALLMKDIGWDAAAHTFVDLEGAPIKSIFKLYPWEWLAHEAFGPMLLETYRNVQWIEPIWKMLWSNKALLAVLWELYPNHPNLLPAYLDGPRDLTRYVKKPKLGREGANITLVGDTTIDRPGDYGEEGFVWQALAPVPTLRRQSPHHRIVGRRRRRVRDGHPGVGRADHGQLEPLRAAHVSITTREAQTEDFDGSHAPRCSSGSGAVCLDGSRYRSRAAGQCSAAVYSAITSHHEMTLIRAGNRAAALSFGGALVGFVIPVAKAVAQSTGMTDLIVWSAIAFVAQLLAYGAAALLVPHLRSSIEHDHVASAASPAGGTCDRDWNPQRRCR